MKRQKRKSKLSNFFNKRNHKNRKKHSGKKRRIFASAVLAGNFLFGNLKPNDLKTNPTPLSHEKVILNQEEESNSFDPSYNSGKTIQTGSGYVIKIQNQQNQPSEALKSALEIRSGDLGKGSSPGSRAKADARRNAQAGKFSSGSTIIPGADGFVPQTTYCRYHENAPLSCKPKVKVSDSPFQDNGGDNQQPPESSQFDASKYKGGPSPFEEYEYKDPAVVAQNIGFNQPNRLNKSYDKHAEDCFGIVENRNKENLEIFKGDITNSAQSAEQVYKGSYRYEDPAYIFLKEINEKMTAVIVNATDGEYITSINPTSGQMEDLQSNGNIGLDTRPSMQLTLRLRGPKNSNL